jgi:hypothetical protein
MVLILLGDGRAYKSYVLQITKTKIDKISYSCGIQEVLWYNEIHIKHPT